MVYLVYGFCIVFTEKKEGFVLFDVLLKNNVHLLLTIHAENRYHKNQQTQYSQLQIFKYHWNYIHCILKSLIRQHRQ